MDQEDKKDFQRKDSEIERLLFDQKTLGDGTTPQTGERIGWTENVLERLKLGRRLKVKTRDRTRSLKREIVELMIYVAVLALFIRGTVLESFHVPTSSMMPTILENDSILVSKASYGFRIPWSNLRIGTSRPERGDVVVFYDSQKKKYFVKRVIGIPGDQLQFAGGILKINQMPITRIAQTDQPWLNRGLVLYQEQISDSKSYGVVESSNDESLSKDVKVADGHYFVMGDFRPTSEDSRQLGSISINQIVGKVFLVWMSYENQSLFQIRWNHLGRVR